MSAWAGDSGTPTRSSSAHTHTQQQTPRSAAVQTDCLPSFDNKAARAQLTRTGALQGPAANLSTQHVCARRGPQSLAARRPADTQHTARHRGDKDTQQQTKVRGLPTNTAAQSVHRKTLNILGVAGGVKVQINACANRQPTAACLFLMLSGFTPCSTCLERDMTNQRCTYTQPPCYKLA